LRIISLISSATEIVSSLGCSDSLVGISHECDYPEKISALPICSEPKFDVSGSSLDVDKKVKSLLQEALSIYRIKEDIISELKPDIIITQSQCKVCAVSLDDVRNALKKELGIKPLIIDLEPNNLNDVLMDIQNLGNVLGKDSASKNNY
jgi:ABC-type hemin transport system, periplasmic component